jgi:HPt (histidine-containing phosphotransfer) domain-containing protein
MTSLAAWAHAVKGVSANVGASDASEEAAKLELAARTNNRAEAEALLEPLCASLRELSERVTRAIDDYQEGGETA